MSEHRPSLTTVQVDGLAIGRQRAALIIGRRQGRRQVRWVFDLECLIVERQAKQR